MSGGQQPRRPRGANPCGEPRSGGRRRRLRGEDGMEGLPRPPSAGAAGAARAAGRLRPAGGDSSAKFARRPSLPENLAARARTRRGTAQSPAPGLGLPPAQRGRPAAERSRGARSPGRGESCTSLKCGPGPARGGVQPGPGGRFESVRGGRAARGPDARRWGERNPRNPRGTKSVPRPESNFGDSRPCRGTRGKFPRGRGPRPLFGESSPPGAEALARAPPGPDSAAGPAPAHTQKMLNETTPTLLAPRPSSGR